MSYQDEIAQAEGTRQQAHKAAVTDADHKSADAAYRQSVLLAQRKWGLHGAGQYIRDRGETPPSPSWLPGE